MRLAVGRFIACERSHVSGDGACINRMFGLDKALNGQCGSRTEPQCKNSASQVAAMRQMRTFALTNCVFVCSKSAANPPANDDRLCATGADMANIGQFCALKAQRCSAWNYPGSL
jgi:hypothetical protein